MGVKFAFQTKGLSTLIDAISALGKTIEEKVDKRLEQSAAAIVADAKARAPRKTGQLVNRIGYEKHGSMDYEVYARKKYAPYVEFGTGTKVDVPQGLEEYAMQFYIGPGVNIPPHPYLFPAYEEERKKMVSDLRSILATNTRTITIIAPS